MPVSDYRQVVITRLPLETGKDGHSLVHREVARHRVGQEPQETRFGKGAKRPLQRGGTNLSGLVQEILGQAGGYVNERDLNDGRQAIVAIQVHHLVPGGDEILDELLVGIGTGVDLRRAA
jgi:hypothetical protein